MGTKISNMSAKGSSDGAELIGVSDSLAVKSISSANIKDYTIEQIEAITAIAAIVSGDKLYALKGGDMSPIDVDVVMQYVIDTVWGKTAIGTPVGADIMVIKDGTVEKTIAMSVLAEYVRTVVEAPILDVSDLTAATTPLSNADYLLVTQSTTGKKAQVSDLNAAIYAALAAYVKALSVAGALQGDDILYIQQSDVEKKVSLSALLAYVGAEITGSGTTDYIAQWVNPSTLKAGPILVSSFTTGSANAIPTSAGVRNEMDEIINDASDIAAAIVDADTFLIDDGGAGTQKKSVMSRIYTYIFGKLPYISEEVDGALVTGANSLTADKLVYAKTCSDSGGDDIITLANGTDLGKIVTIFLDEQTGTDDAIITPATSMSYDTITLSAETEIATLQWQGALVGWAILYTNGAIDA